MLTYLRFSFEQRLSPGAALTNAYFNLHLVGELIQEHAQTTFGDF